MKFKKIIYFILAFALFYIIVNKYIIGENKFTSLKQSISKETKTKIKKYLFPYKYMSELQNTADMLSQTVEANNKDVLRLRERLDKKDLLISAIPEKIGYGEFYQEKETIFEINKTNFSFKEFKDYFLVIKKASSARSGSVYIDKIDDKIIILSGNGLLQYFDKKSLKESRFKTKIIKSNIRDIIKYKDFYSNSKFGVKDLLIIDDIIYFSFVREVSNNCFNTSILKAKLNFDKLIFEEFFFPAECILGDKEWFEAHSSGGRMVKFNDKMIFSIGEYLSRSKAQDPKSIFGKIIVLDPLDRSNYKLLSMGHRNVQGLLFDDENKTIVSSEHGPQGGDEINVNRDFIQNNDKINNYGWPISSYGEHYGCINNKSASCWEQYAKYPFHKSHSDYGFEEPLKYFTPSIAISQLIKLNNNFFSDQEKIHLLVGALGTVPAEGDMSLHYIKTSKDYQKIINHEIININSRVRDMVVLDEKQVLISMETNSTIGILKIVE
jgi:hypothetical protein